MNTTWPFDRLQPEGRKGVARVYVKRLPNFNMGINGITNLVLLPVLRKLGRWSSIAKRVWNKCKFILDVHCYYCARLNNQCLVPPFSLAICILILFEWTVSHNRYAKWNIVTRFFHSVSPRTNDSRLIASAGSWHSRVVEVCIVYLLRYRIGLEYERYISCWNANYSFSIKSKWQTIWDRNIAKIVVMEI